MVAFFSCTIELRMKLISAARWGSVERESTVGWVLVEVYAGRLYGEKIGMLFQIDASHG